MLDYSIVTLVENLNTEYHRKLRDHSFIKALLAILSDNSLNQSQNNAVFPTQKVMDWAGFEPTTSAPSMVASVLIESPFKYPSHFPNQIFLVGCPYTISLL
jgi:hypothetical protein